MFAQREGNEK